MTGEARQDRCAYPETGRDIPTDAGAELRREPMIAAPLLPGQYAEDVFAG